MPTFAQAENNLRYLSKLTEKYLGDITVLVNTSFILHFTQATTTTIGQVIFTLLLQQPETAQING